MGPARGKGIVERGRGAEQAFAVGAFVVAASASGAVVAASSQA